MLITGVICASVLSSSASAQPGWDLLTSGSTHNLSAVHFANIDTGYVAGAAGTVLRTTNAGATWQNVSPPGVTADLNGIYAFAEPTNRVVTVGGGGTIRLTTDGGANWAPVSSGVSDDLFSVSFMGGAGICGGGSQTILSTADSGNSWVVRQSGFLGGGFWGACMLSPQIGMVGGENSIFQPLFGKTTDSGSSWDFVAFYLNGNEGRAYGIDFTDALVGYAAAGVWDGRGAIARTTDGGSNWTTNFFPDVLYSMSFPISATGLVGYAVGASGRILKTVDAGNHWEQQVSGTTSTLRGVHFLDFVQGYVVGDGGIVLRTLTGGEPSVSVHEQPRDRTPGSFALLQNYPNPFNPCTAINFSLPSSGMVTLSVFTTLGERVAIPVKGVRDAGSHTINWDASAFPGGVYICRLEAEGFVKTRKMVLLR